MNLAYSTSWTRLVDLIAILGIVALFLVEMRMIWEINRVLPTGRRLGYLTWSWTPPRLLPLHKELFPSSRLRLLGWIILVTWLPFGTLSYIRRTVIGAWLAR